MEEEDGWLSVASCTKREEEVGFAVFCRPQLLQYLTFLEDLVQVDLDPLDGLALGLVDGNGPSQHQGNLNREAGEVPC